MTTITIMTTITTTIQTVENCWEAVNTLLKSKHRNKHTSVTPVNDLHHPGRIQFAFLPGGWPRTVGVLDLSVPKLGFLYLCHALLQYLFKENFIKVVIVAVNTSLRWKGGREMTHVVILSVGIHPGWFSF